MSAAANIGAIVAAVRTVIACKSDRVALHEPEFRGNERQYVNQCIESGWVSSVGPFVDRLEAMLADYTGAGQVIATMNGTAALHVCLQLVNVQPGDEVLVPALTFIATANSISYCHAQPHFIDSEWQTLGVDAEKLDRHLQDTTELRGGLRINKTTGKRIAALVVMHTFGHPANVDALLAVCDKYRLPLVEDAAESLGSLYTGKHTGRFGRVAALSFNGNKVVTTGGGGAVMTDDPELGRHAKHLTTTARVPHRWSFIHDEVGFNYRMPNLNAALGIGQLERLSGLIERKRKLADRYAHAFHDVPGVRVIREPPRSRSNYWLNAIALEGLSDAAFRDAVLENLHADGVLARPCWTLMHRLPMYSSCTRMDLSVAEDIERRLINLPSSGFLAD